MLSTTRKQSEVKKPPRLSNHFAFSSIFVFTVKQGPRRLLFSFVFYLLVTCLPWSLHHGVVTFLGFLMQCGVKSLSGASGIYPDTYSLGLFAGLFSGAVGYCLLIVLCEMTSDWL